MDIPIPKTPVIEASHFHITLAIWVRVTVDLLQVGLSYVFSERSEREKASFNEVAQRPRDRGSGEVKEKPTRKKKFKRLLESLGLQGMPMSLRFREWRDAHITVTSLPTFPDHARLTFLHSPPSLSLTLFSRRFYYLKAGPRQARNFPLLILIHVFVCDVNPTHTREDTRSTQAFFSIEF